MNNNNNNNNYQLLLNPKDSNLSRIASEVAKDSSNTLDFGTIATESFILDYNRLRFLNANKELKLRGIFLTKGYRLQFYIRSKNLLVYPFLLQNMDYTLRDIPDIIHFNNYLRSCVETEVDKLEVNKQHSHY